VEDCKKFHNDRRVTKCHQKPVRNALSVSLGCAHLTFSDMWGGYKRPVPVYKNDGLVTPQATQCHPPQHSFTRATKPRRHRMALLRKAKWSRANSGYVNPLPVSNVPPSTHTAPAVADYERSVECRDTGVEGHRCQQHSLVDHLNKGSSK
jgi:hypothetical protein